MGTPTGSDNVIDYSQDYENIRSEIAQTRTALGQWFGTLNNHLETLNQHQASIDSHLDAIRERAVTETLGVVIRPTDPEYRFGRAAMINALRKASQLDDVIAELLEPTDIPAPPVNDPEEPA